jgi:DNA modification methylase
MSEALNQVTAEQWTAIHGDCVEVLRGLPDKSIDMSVFSPPYGGTLYTYSNSPRDIGNCRGDAEFYEHFGYVVDELRRVIKPGRIVAVDCMNIPAMKERDGYIGLKDFRGDLIREFQNRGFIFHSEHCIWRDPLIEATRTKALGLMHKQLCKDSTMSRAGIPQYLLAFRAPGVNASPVSHPDGLTDFAGENGPKSGTLSHERWRRYASPVWMDIRSTRTLNGRGARAESDEKHICPLALDIIERALTLWSKRGDTVLSPFMGIGSEGVVSVEMGRRFVGIELKESYYKQAVANLKSAHEGGAQRGLFDAKPEVEPEETE